jgi:N-acetylglucosamine kinase-like BadF-type ATPase
VDVAITDVKGDSLLVTVLSGSVKLGGGGLTIWCYGAKHTWQGKLTYAGYTFASDATAPLQFMVDKDKGYVYIKGKGSVKFPNGKIVHLPN